MDSRQTQYNQLFSFIWNIANDVLVHAFNKGDYKKIILPMMVLRRLDLLLDPTHQEVLETLQKYDIKNESTKKFLERQLFQVTGYPFYNTSPFTMSALRGETNEEQLYKNFLDYLDGYSSDVLDIIDKFKLKQQIDNLRREGRLGSIIDKFTDLSINLGIKPVLAGHYG